MSGDLKGRFTIADRVLEAPDVWAEARRRATAGSDGAVVAPGASRSGADRHRVVTAAVAFAVFTAAAVFAWDLSHPERRLRSRPAVDLTAELPVGWSELPAPPENRSGAATAWTGSELLVWGGYEFVGHGDENPDGDGFAFEAETRRWRTMPDSPLAGRSDAASAWTGEELLIWGGYDGGFREHPFFDDGAAFDPEAGTWRMLPDAPIGGRTPFSVWTGRELIVWGNTDRSARMRDGAAYDANTDTWRRITEAPIDVTDGSAVWTGEEMIVFGAALDGNNRADTRTAIGAAYDPAADSWRELPPSDLSPQASTAEWLGGELIAWDYEHGSAAYDPSVDGWRKLDDVPLRFFECDPQSATIPGHVFGDFCGQLALYSATDDAWRKISRDDLRDWLIEPAGAGRAFLVMAHSFEVSEQPNVTFETRMLAYVPPGEEGSREVRDLTPFVPATETVGDTTRMALVFPGGTQATILYPADLRLAEGGVQPDVSYSFRGRYQGPIVFLHDSDPSVARYVEADAGSILINTSVGGLELFRARGDEPGFWIRFDLPSWTLLVPIEDPDGGAMRAAALAAEVAASLHLRETSTGFPIVQASGDAELLEGFGEAGGAQLAFGDSSPVPDIVSQLDATLFLSPDGCTPVTDTDFPGGYGASCLGDGQVFASIYGDRGFVNSVIKGLRVEDVVPA